MSNPPAASPPPSAVRIDFRYPVLVLVILGTAIPVELRRLGSIPIGFDIWWTDVVLNIVAYAAIGLVLGEMRAVRAILLGAVVSIAAEACQLIIRDRTPSAVDVAMNVLGVVLGTMAGRRLGIRTVTIPFGRRAALGAGSAAIGILLWTWQSSGVAVNLRGFSAPGRLEAHWSFDESSGGRVRDASGNDVDGTLVGKGSRTPGVFGSGVQLDGKNDWVAIDRSSELRLVGSMTICAWIRPASYPADDAAIVSSLSSHGRGGVQLDATVDRGPRLIGFKMADECGVFMARYGSTPLSLNTWHHVIGVYDAETGTIDVYLNGKLDNGVRVGMVSHRRWSSRTPVYLGRRSVLEGFGFCGSIDDVRIFSSALTEIEIASVVRGVEVRPAAATGPRPPADGAGPFHPDCRPSDREDTVLPVLAGLLGLLSVLACAGLRPALPVLVCLGIAAGLGGLLLAGLAAPLPRFNVWLIPLTSLVGGVAALAARGSTGAGTAGPRGVLRS